MKRTKIKTGISFISLLLLGSTIEAQVQVKGKILDNNGLSVAGVLVEAVSSDKKYKQKMTASENGTFIFSNLDSSINYSFYFDQVGYQKDTVFNYVPDSKNNLLLIRLKANYSSLEEVVVTGQGAAVSKKRLPNNVVSVTAKDLENVPGQRIDQLLSAKLPNAQLNLTSGQAGSTSIIKSRGVSSAFLSSTPIIYIDGVRMDNLNTRSTLGGLAQGSAMSSIADIPTENIDHIEYINGGAATTIYGSDAANGVIQIFTKKSGERGNHLSLGLQSGLVTPTTDYLFFKRSKDLLLTNGYSQKYNIALNGSSGNGFGYNIAASYYENGGVQIYNQNKNRLASFTSGFTAKITDKISYESSFSYVYNRYKRNRNGNQGGYTGLWFAEDGASKITGPGFDNRLDDLSFPAYDSIKAYVNNAERLQNSNISTNRFTTSQTLKYRPVTNLIFKLTAGLDYRNQDQSTIETNEYLSAIKGSEITNQGSISNFTRNYTGVTLELNGQHKFNTGKFSFISTLGGQLFRTKDHQITYVGTNIRDGAYTISDASVKTADEALLEVLNYGIYAQENIGIGNNLFFDMGIRGDRNPAFGKNIGTQFYPKAGFSYLMSSSKWFDVPAINMLRLRTSYGVAGNLPPAYANEKTISFTGFNNQQAAYFGQQGNDDLRPEKTKTLEGGLDLGLFNDFLNITATFYDSRTDDALFYVTPAPSTGYTVSQLRNVGKIQNRGFELNTTWNLIRKKNYALSFNTSVNTVKNKVIDAGGAPAFNLAGFSARTVQTVVEEGHPVGYIRGSRGHFNANGVLESYDALQDLGSTIPTLYGNIGLNFRYKNLSIFSTANYQKGAYAVNWDAQFRYYYGASDLYVPAAEITAHKRTNWLNMTDRFVQKTDFLKIRNIGAGYDITFNAKTSIKSLNVSFNAVNPLNFHSGDFDPETTLSGAAQGQGAASTGGVVYATYSAPREFILSIKANF